MNVCFEIRANMYDVSSESNSVSGWVHLMDSNDRISFDVLLFPEINRYLPQYPEIECFRKAIQLSQEGNESIALVARRVQSIKKLIVPQRQRQEFRVD